MALLGGRFSQTADSRFTHFNNSLAIDHRLAKQDILGSIAWSKALNSVKVLTDEEQIKIERLLQALLVTIEADPNILLQSQAEDIHSWVEEELIKQLGDLGKKLHTGRSRNDQVTTDLKLWCKMQVDLTTNELNILRHNLVACADRYQDAIMPGYTHLQPAQPITFAHWCLAYFDMFSRDHSRLKEALVRLDKSPLGSGPLLGQLMQSLEINWRHGWVFQAPQPTVWMLFLLGIM